MLTAVKKFIVRRPLIARGLVTLAVGLAAHFGGDLAVEQTLQATTVLGALLGLEAQRHLTPIAAPRLPKGRKADRYEQ